MSNYTKSTNFTAKDSLPTGDTNKVVRGSEFDTEFNAISTAIATKSDLAGPTFTGTATFANITATGTINFSSATVSNLGAVTTVDINGGTIDGATIGANSASTGNFTTLSINGTAITSTAAELNILDGVTSTAAELNILDGKSFVDEDDMSSNSATAIPSQQSVKAYVDSQTGLGGATLAGLADTNVTSPADAALLFYDTGTSKWIDNVVSGDVTIADTGVASIGSGVIVNADISGSAAIDISKLNGVTATASELNILDGVTSTTAELNILDGVTSTATELNLVDGSTADTVVNSKAVIYGSAGQITANELDVDNIQLDANAVKSTDTNGNIQLFPNGTGFTELYGNTNAGTIRFNCENNSHGVTVQGPAHSAAATYTVKLPDTLGLTQASGLVTSDANGVVSFDNGTIDEVTTVTSSSNAAIINLRDGNVFEHDLTENVTYTFSNPAASGRASAFVLKIIQDSSARTITWPGSVDWAAATAPTITATNNGVDVFVFLTIDGGTTYYGFTAGQAMG